MPANKPASTDPLSAGHIDAGATTESHDRMHGRTLRMQENVKAYGAVGDGVTNDAAAISAAFTALANATNTVGSSGTLLFPPGIYIYNSATPLSLTSFMKMQGQSRWSSVLKFTGSAGLTFIDNSHDATVRDMSLWGAGTCDTITWPTGGAAHYASYIHFENCVIAQDNTAKHVIYGTNTAMIFCKFIGVDFYAATGTTVSPIALDGAGNINADTFQSCLFQANSGLASGIPFCSIQNTNDAGFNYQINFRDIWCENTIGGAISLTSVSNCIIESVILYDPSAPTNGDIVYLGQDAGGQLSQYCTVSQVDTLGSLGASKYAVNAEGARYITIRNVRLGCKVNTNTKIYDGFASSGTPIWTHGVDAQPQPALPAGLQMQTKAGTPVDGDYNSPTNGLLVVDTTGNRIWVRTAAGTWKSVVVA